MLLAEVVTSFENHGVPYAVVGGYAVALHGAVRGTLDVDVITELSSEGFQRIHSALNSIGLVSRLPITPHELWQNFEVYRKERNLIAWSFYHPEYPIKVVDVILSKDVRSVQVLEIIKSSKIASRRVCENIKVISVDDLIAMKQASGRRQDLEDVKALEHLYYDKKH